jgi:hypothetical protein
MLLAEVLIEKDYISKSIDNLYNIIRDLSIVYDKSDVKFNKEQLRNKFEELEELYTKYQQFSIMICRAKSVTVIINETEISLRDAMVVRDVMNTKLNRLSNFSLSAVKKDTDSIVCIDKEELEKMIEILRSDIKTLDIKIQNKLWATKVK